MKKKMLPFLFIVLMTLISGGSDVSAYMRKHPLSAQPLTPLSSHIKIQDQIGNSPKNIANDLGPCDSGLALDSYDPLDAAKAIDICKTAADPDDWGLVSAAWVMADGAEAVSSPGYPLGHGLLPGFGNNVTVQGGERLLALSSGAARQPTDPCYVDVYPGFNKGYTGGYPDGFPKGTLGCSGSCPATATPHDDAALEVVLRIPHNAAGISFDFKFYTTDYPVWTCTIYNDLFVAILDPIPAGQTDGNIALDTHGDPMTVNSGDLQVCSAVSCYTCELGTADLDGTGFEDHGATGWLTASTPVEPGGLITLRFAIYDSGDGTNDSTVLIDNFRWLWMPPSIWLPIIVK